MIIPDQNAFTINRLAGSFFPFSFKTCQKERAHSLFVCAQSVVDVCALIERYALANLVVFCVEQSSQFDPQTDQPVSLAGLAIHAKTGFSAIDSQTIILPKANLYPLLSTFSHCNLSLFDMGSDWNEDQVIRQVLACRERDWGRGGTILSELPASQIFLDSHDDCYLSMETFHSELPGDVFARTLQIYTGTLLAEVHASAPDIPEMPRELLETFWKTDSAFTMLQQAARLKNDCLQMGVSRRPYHFGEAEEYPVEFWITYELQSRKWRVAL